MDIPRVLMYTKMCHGPPGRSSPRSSYGMGQLNIARLDLLDLSRQKLTTKLSATGARIGGTVVITR
jgi:hypothetical protein